jgi:hypothetical protein
MSDGSTADTRHLLTNDFTFFSSLGDTRYFLTVSWTESGSAAIEFTWIRNGLAMFPLILSRPFGSRRRRDPLLLKWRGLPATADV